MTMTIQVYKIHKDGRRTEIVPRYEVGTGDPERLQMDLGYPPCRCPHHRREARVSR
ncbi:hypothetical protein O3Q52_16685 [Streptomyces sp. ActVer]|uniref:hypothetical protein n=1 Tax=Streptomyces sp. ActVer TaxID=3014558 RepID=UPI0022B4AB24|nr:hypothetical protein [Streptomyces sp. ActVer]MCZ4509803.1 hypothetical protein [Streptomyces sp. ActVer]